MDGGYQLAAGAALPPLVLDDEEAVALAVGLQAAAQARWPGIAEASVRALAKVVQVMPPRLRRRVDALRAVDRARGVARGGPAVDPDVLTAVAQACRDAERLRVRLHRRGRASAPTRLVEPLRLVPLGRRWYLVAYDLHRHDWRSFRLDRLAAPRRTGRAVPPARAAGRRRRRVRPRRDRRPPRPYDVEVVVDAPAAAVRERVGRWGTVEEVGAGRAAPDEHGLPRLGGAGARRGGRGVHGGLARPSCATCRGWGARFGRAAA